MKGYTASQKNQMGHILIFHVLPPFYLGQDDCRFGLSKITGSNANTPLTDFPIDFCHKIYFKKALTQDRKCKKNGCSCVLHLFFYILQLQYSLNNKGLKNLDKGSMAAT